MCSGWMSYDENGKLTDGAGMKNKMTEEQEKERAAAEEKAREWAKTITAELDKLDKHRNINLKLRAMYLDFFDNYMSVEKFAEDSKITVKDATTLLEMGGHYHDEHVKFYLSHLKGRKANNDKT